MSKKEKRLYFITPVKDNGFYDQFEWADNLLQKEESYLFNSDFKVFRAREIYSYTRKFDIQLNRPFKGNCVIMDMSQKYENKVLICPIYPKSMAENKFGINIGHVYELSDTEEFIAALSEIKYVSKARFKEYGKTLNSAKSIGVLSQSAYLRILESYKNIIDAIIKKTTNYSPDLLYNGRILSA